MHSSLATVHSRSTNKFRLPLICCGTARSPSRSINWSFNPTSSTENLRCRSSRESKDSQHQLCHSDKGMYPYKQLIKTHTKSSFHTRSKPFILPLNISVLIVQGATWHGYAESFISRLRVEFLMSICSATSIMPVFKWGDTDPTKTNIGLIRR